MLENLPLIQSLADFDAPKPLECVGTKEEVWVALEDIWQKGIWRRLPGLKHFARHSGGLGNGLDDPAPTIVRLEDGQPALQIRGRLAVPSQLTGRE